MGTIKELNIKNQIYYFFNDIIDIRNFQSSLLKIDKKLCKDLTCTILVTLRLKKLVTMKIFIA